MNPEIKERWVAALRSGDYKQVSGFLRLRTVGTNDVRHCCLGVLCELAQQDGVIDPPDETSVGVSVYKFTNRMGNADSTRGVLPYPVVEWAGLHSTNPAVRDHDAPYAEMLSNLNDTGISFAEIARLIEESL